MKSNFALIASIFTVTAFLFGCDSSSSSSSDSLDDFGSSGRSEEEFAARCNDVFGITEEDTWSTSLVGNKFIEEEVCDKITEYMGYQLAFYARCTSARFSQANNRFEVEVITEQRYMHIWAEIDGCSYKLGTDGDMQPLIAKGREWTLDECLCKAEGEATSYRVISPKQQDSSSDSMQQDESSSSKISTTSSNSDMEDASSSSQEGSSSSEKTTSGSSSSSSEPDSDDVSSSSGEIVIPEGSLEKKCDECNSFIDKRDGNIYRVTEIDNVIWMAEDLRYKSPEFANQIHCSDQNHDCSNRGYLYTFAAAMNETDCSSGNKCASKITYPHQGICPEGFHLPMNREWQNLKNYLVVNIDAITNLTTVLKTKKGWGISGKDTYGFSALPTGEFNGTSISFDNIARYWTSSEYNAESAYEWYLGDSYSFTNQTYSKGYGYAVRCIADGKIELTEVKDDPRPKSSSSSVSSSSSSESSSSETVNSSSSEYEYRFSVTQADGCENCNAFTDTRDNNTYRVVKIVGEIWMAEDLRYGGTEEEPLDGAYCPDQNGCVERGRLYAYDALGEACPEGWRVPSSGTMKKLFDDFVTSQGSSSGNTSAVCAAGNIWGTYCTNESGFSSVPTGEWGSSGFKDDNYARYWTSSVHDGSNSYMWYLKPGEIRNQTYLNSYGYAVRCTAAEDVVLDAVK